MSRDKEHRPNGAAAPLGASPKAAPLCSLFLIISHHKYLWIFLLYSCIFLHIFLEYSSYMSCILSMYVPLGVSYFIPSTISLDVTKIQLVINFGTCRSFRM